MQEKENSFLKKLIFPRDYLEAKIRDSCCTEDDKTFLELQKLNCPVKIIHSENDLADLESYDIVQAVECFDTQRFLKHFQIQFS